MMPDLITLWLAGETAIPGRTAADALRDYNAEHGAALTHSRLREMQDGRRGVPLSVRHYAASVAGDRIQRELDILIDDADWERLIALLLR